MTKYIVDSNGLSQVLAELDSNNKVVAEYTHGIEIVSQIRNKITHYYLFDGNGNVRILTDKEGAVSDTYDYDSFGIATASTGLTVNPYRYCGEYQDETTGLYYLRARYYDSTTGRFISADSYSGSLSDPVSLHKYLYAAGNPVMNSDPTGYFTLYGMTAAIQVENTLRDMYNSALTGGFMSFIDALAGEETDPYKLLQAFGNGAMEGLKSSAITASLTAVRNLGCLAPKLAMLSSLALVGLSGKSTFEALQGAVDSLLEGNYKQALFRALGFGLSAYGTYKASAAAFDTMTGVINGTKCFVAGTLVLTEDGEKPIEEIKPGDRVFASDPETGESGYKEVVQTFENETEELVHVYANGDEIVSTPTHPFYSPQRGWTSAADLRAGDILVLSNGNYVVVEQVQHEILEAPVKVYNFEVLVFHTYYVGKNSVLVHNMCKINGEIPKNPTQKELSNTNIELPKTKFTTKKLQHEYKHSSDFGVEGNWNKIKETEYQQAIQNHIDSASEIFQSTYRGEDVYLYLNRETGIGAYVSTNGDYIGGWKFSENQIQFHLNNGTRIK